MVRSRRLTLPALLAVALLGLAACGEDDPVAGPSDTTAGDDTTSTTAVPTFPAGSTMAKLQAAGKITVGVKFDQPGFGLKNPTNNKVEGFDVEIAKLVAAGIFGGTAAEAEPKIEFVESVSKNREPFIQEEKVNLVVATYTINDTRKEVVDFAGPYFVARQDIMVKSDDTTIKSVEDLNGKKVCTVKGSTSEKNVRAKAPQAEVSLFDQYSQCAEELGNGRVAAVSTDNTILAGLAQASGGAYKLVKAPFSDEPYGLGMKKGDEAFRAFLNERLETIYASGEWAEAFASTLGKIGLETPQPPTVNRYTAGAAGGTTTTTGAGGATTTTTAAPTVSSVP